MRPFKRRIPPPPWEVPAKSSIIAVWAKKAGFRELNRSGYGKPRQPGKPGFGKPGRDGKPGRGSAKTSQRAAVSVRAASLLVIAAMVITAAATAAMTGGRGPHSSDPTEREPGAYAKWRVRQAIARHQSNLDNALPEDDPLKARQATIDYYNTQAESDGEWHTFIVDAETGLLEAHTAFPHLLGSDITAKVDVNGNPYGEQILAAPEQGVWVDYVYLNPATDRGGLYHAWIVRHEGLLFGSGWYERSYNRPEVTLKQPYAYTRQLAEDAIWYYQANGIDKLLAYYNSPVSTHADWHVFLFNADGEILAHPKTGGQNPSTGEDIGQSPCSPLGTDNEGYTFGATMLTAEEPGLWVDYQCAHTGKVLSNEHAWVMRIDDIFVAAVWQEGLAR